jgi:hypothetical protein
MSSDNGISKLLLALYNLCRVAYKNKFLKHRNVFLFLVSTSLFHTVGTAVTQMVKGSGRVITCQREKRCEYMVQKANFHSLLLH